MSFTETRVNTLHSLLSKTVTHMELELKHISSDVFVAITFGLVVIVHTCNEID
jgi:hypothetical protein